MREKKSNRVPDKIAKLARSKQGLMYTYTDEQANTYVIMNTPEYQMCVIIYPNGYKSGYDYTALSAMAKTASEIAHLRSWVKTKYTQDMLI